MIARCNLCPPSPTGLPEDDEAFRVPWDEHGEALMVGHLRKVHGLTEADIRPPGWSTGKKEQR